MLLGAEIAGTKPIQVITVEILKLHCHGCSSHGQGEPAYFRLPVPLFFGEERTSFAVNDPLAIT